jgi:hypothetical protein
LEWWDQVQAPSSWAGPGPGADSCTAELVTARSLSETTLIMGSNSDACLHRGGVASPTRVYWGR